MKSTSRFFLKAVTAALLLSSAGFAYSEYKQSRTHAIQRECEAESAKILAKFEVEKAKNPALNPFDFLPKVCEPYELRKASSERNGEIPSGVEGRLLLASLDEQNEVPSLLNAIAALVLVVGSLPAIWYFLLARLAEIAAAVRRG